MPVYVIGFVNGSRTASPQVVLFRIYNRNGSRRFGSSWRTLCSRPSLHSAVIHIVAIYVFMP